MIIAGIIEFSTTEKEISLSNTTVTETNGGKNVTITMPNGRKRVVKSAASRYDIKGNNIPWVQKTGEQKMGTILKGYALVLAIIVLIFLIIAKSTPSDGSFIYFIINNEFERGVNLFSITAIILLFISVLVISAIVRTLILLVSSNLGARTETIGRLIETFIKYGTVIGLVFYSLYLLGVNTTSILTSAGILTLVVGFGSQSLIKDIIAGIFIVFEGEFRVGDIVTVGDW